MIQGSVTPKHPRWDEFAARLLGPEGCDFRGDRWTCFGDLRFSRRILQAMGLDARSLEVSVAYFQDHSAYCDCEVLLNVARVM